MSKVRSEFKMIEALTMPLNGSDMHISLLHSEHYEVANISFGENFQLIDMTYDQVHRLTKALKKLEKIFEDAALFVRFSESQLRWYVACCRLDAMACHDEGSNKQLRQAVVSYWLDDSVRDELIPHMNKKELIAEAISHNEDAENASRRIEQSLTGECLHWPKYIESTGDDDGGGR